MDPTMETPRLLPSGPHFYPVKSWVGSISQGNTPQQAFAALLPRATPFQSGPSIDDTVDIPVLGRVKQFVDPDHLTIVNTTLPGHIAHPGNVFRSIVQEGDDLYVVTHGYGTGVLPWLNENAAPSVWRTSDIGIRLELNPYTLLGYPTDEMNAPAGITGQPQAAPFGSTSNGAWGSAIGNSFAGGIDRAGSTL